MTLPRPRLVVLTAEGTPRPCNEAALQELADVRWATAADLEPALRGADVLLSWDFLSTALRDAWGAAEELRWVHVAAAGVDAMLFDALAESSVVLTNSRGVFDQPIAEFVLASVLAHDKRLHESKDLQREHRWVHREVTRSAGQHVLVVGTGAIGRACGRLLQSVGLTVRGAGRREASGDPDLGDIVLTSALAEHVGWADHVVLTAPLTPETRHVVSGAVLAAMKPTAHLVNVGRGALVDETALVAALQAGEIAAASLDVVETEPLPEASLLWDLPQVAISAHMCGDVVGWRDQLALLFEDNLRRYVAGEALLNQVDTRTGFPYRG